MGDDRLHRKLERIDHKADNIQEALNLLNRGLDQKLERLQDEMALIRAENTELKKQIGMQNRICNDLSCQNRPTDSQIEVIKRQNRQDYEKSKSRRKSTERSSADHGR